MILKHHIATKNLKNDDTSEYDMTANAYSNHYTGFRIKSGMTKESVSSLGEGRSPETRGSINNDIITLDSRVFANATHKNDRKRNATGIHKT